MKKILIALLFIAFTISGYSQEHLEFMGMPITGSLKSFSGKLQEKGFKLLTTGNLNELKGRFAGEDVEILIQTTPTSHIVSTVMIGCKTHTRWEDLINEFEEKIKQYTIKYGDPITVVREFEDPFKDTETHQMLAVKGNKIKHIAGWKADHGIITIMIFPSGNVVISYSDSINLDLEKLEAQEIVQRDI